MVVMGFSRFPSVPAVASACAAVVLLTGCAHGPDLGSTTMRLPTASHSASDSASDSASQPYDRYAPPSPPPGMTSLPGFRDLGPPDPTDPSGDLARQVLDRHRAQIEAIPGWQADGIGRRHGRNVIIVMTRRPVPYEDRIAALDGVPLVYRVAGPFVALQ
jgi:hypothetical protein